MKISESSLLLKIAYFPRYAYHKENDQGTDLGDFLAALIAVSFFKEPAVGFEKVPSRRKKISTCSLFWRLIFSWIPIIYLLVVVSFFSIAFPIFGLCLYGMYFVAKRLMEMKKKVFGGSSHQAGALSLGNLISAQYKALKDKTCPLIEVVE